MSKVNLSEFSSVKKKVIKTIVSLFLILCQNKFDLNQEKIVLSQIKTLGDSPIWDV